MMRASSRELVGGSVFGRARLGPRATAAIPPEQEPARTARKHCHQPILTPPPPPPLPPPLTSKRLNAQTSKRPSVKRPSVQTSKRLIVQMSRYPTV